MEKLSLWISPGEPYNISRAEYWIKKQYGQLISTLSEIQDPDQLVKDCRKIYPVEDLNKKYRQIIDDFKRQQLNTHADEESVATYFNGWYAQGGQTFVYEQSDFSDLPDFEVPFDKINYIDYCFGGVDN